MGGQGSGRKPDPLKQFSRPETPVAHAPDPMFLPDYSGVSADKKTLSVFDARYATGSVEGTAVLSTGEGGATKFLREDGDGTCSWQTGSGGVSDHDLLNNLDYASAGHINFASGSEVLGMSGSVTLNSSEILGTSGSVTLNTSDILGASGSITLNTSDVLGMSGSVTTNTGNILGMSGSVTTNTANILGMSGSVTTNTTHRNDTTNPHTTTLTQDNMICAGSISGGVLLTPGDHTTLSGSALTVGVIMSTDAVPLAASGYALGTIYLQHAA